MDTNDKVTQIQREVSKITNDLPKDANTPIVRKVDAATYMGSGKIEEIKAYADSLNASMVVFNDELSGAHIGSSIYT